MTDTSTAAISRAAGATTHAREAVGGGLTTPCCEQWHSFDHAAACLESLSWWAELIQQANRHARRTLPPEAARFAQAQDRAIEKAREALGVAAQRLRAVHVHVGSLCQVRSDMDLPHDD
ncbi:hypothetical protein [Kutzneria buriramensis]|uniref:Uncharacterized protein n=1 Tax=Kutzneria buriramensis TaxID=1045776 RepID=A0A3E0GU90_9PSEU|nr:hypothetical protein [Kutzneria buriramensis]REH26001.1 hypothetical protein BCF44_13540 [Kutzneria buriramensis]